LELGFSCPAEGMQPAKTKTTAIIQNLISRCQKPDGRILSVIKQICTFTLE
jgi:hypothetical protein